MRETLNYILIFIIITIMAFLLSLPLFKNEGDTPKQLYTLEIIEADNSWIYEIRHNNILYIKQEYIPVVEGKKRFKSERDAAVIGNLVLKNYMIGIILP